MGEHVNTKKDPLKRHKRGFSEGQDIATKRKQRVTFKHYMQELEEELLEQELQQELDAEDQELDSDDQ